MGFFSVPDEVMRAAPKPRARAPRDDTPSVPGCDGCSLQSQWPRLTTPRMGLSGNVTDGDILVLGEAPGAEEDALGTQFIGKSGRMLQKLIPGREMDRVVFQNTVRCRPPDNATPKSQDIKACGLYLDEEIERLPLKAIVGVGGVPLTRFYPKQNITRLHGVKFPVQIGQKVLWYYPVLHPSYALRTGDDRSPAFYTLRADMRRFFREVDNWPEPKIWTPRPEDVKQPATEAEARAILATMVGPLGLDLETQKLKPYLIGAALLTAAVSDGTTTMAWSINHPEAPTSWGLDLLLEIAATRQWVAHNANFELQWLIYMARQAGKEWRSARFDDSQACGRVYYEREKLGDKYMALELMTRIELGTDVKTLHVLNMDNMAAEPLSEVLPYNGLDAQACVLLFNAMRPRVDNDNYERLVQTTEATVRMELMGLPFNLDVAAELKTEWQAKKDAAIKDVRSIYEVKQFEATKQIEFKISSPQDVGEALVLFGNVPLPKTSKKGDDGVMVEGVQWSTTDDNLLKFAPGNPLAIAVLADREASHQMSTYIDSTFKYCAETVDGLLHPGYTVMFTATTRLSSRGPNIQNYPSRKHKPIRRQLKAPPGHILLSADLGQIDARVYACETKDRNLCESFINDEDIHSLWRDQALELYPQYLTRLARETNETDEKKILKGARNIIKSDFVFASFYGSLAKQINERTGIPMDIVHELLHRFWKKYPQAFKWLKNQRQIYADTGMIQSLCGMIRRGIMWGNEPINSPVQTGTSHLMNDALIDLSKQSLERHDPYLHPRLQIHDDILLIVPDQEDAIEGYIKIVGEAMTKVRYDWQIVPIIVEFKVGYDWADMEEITVVKGDWHR